MYPLIATFVALSATGLTLLARAARSAPEGFEDAKGFHACNPDDLTVSEPAGASFGVRELLFLEQGRASQPWS